MFCELCFFDTVGTGKSLSESSQKEPSNQPNKKWIKEHPPTLAALWIPSFLAALGPKWGLFPAPPPGGVGTAAMAAAVAAAVRRRDEQRANGQGGEDSDAVVRSITKSTVAPEDLLPPWLDKNGTRKHMLCKTRSFNRL